MVDDFAHAAFRERRARQTMRRRALYVHIAVWLAVNLFLVVIWAMLGGGFAWFVFPFFGWGIGVAAHAATTVWIARPNDLLLEEEERRLARGG